MFDLFARFTITLFMGRKWWIGVVGKKSQIWWSKMARWWRDSAEIQMIGEIFKA